LRWLEADERPISHELAHSYLAREVIPAEDRGKEAEPPRMVLSERDSGGDRLVCGQEALFRDEGLASDLDLQRWAGAQIAHPLGFRPPGGADDGLARLSVVANSHSDRLTAHTRLAALVRNQEEGVTEQASPATVVEGLGESHEPERESAGTLTQAEQRPFSVVSVCDSAHDFVTGGLKIFDS
jgi:hypothetical protein